MKKPLLYILMFSLITSCEIKKYSEIYAEYIDSFDKIYKFHIERNNELFSIIEDRKENYYKKEFQNCFEIKNISDQIIEIFATIEKDMNNNYNSYNKIDNDTLNKIIKLTDSILNYFETEEVKKNAPVIVKVSNTILDFESWKNINGLNNKKCKNIELLAIIKKLKCDYKKVENLYLTYIVSFTEMSSDIFLVHQPIVYPKSKNIKFGENFEAQIYFGMIDTTICPDIFIEDKKIEYNFLYLPVYKKKIITNSTGIIKENGYFEIKTSKSEKQKIPFEIIYNVTE